MPPCQSKIHDSQTATDYHVHKIIRSPRKPLASMNSPIRVFAVASRREIWARQQPAFPHTSQRVRPPSKYMSTRRRFTFPLSTLTRAATLRKSAPANGNYAALMAARLDAGFAADFDGKLPPSPAATPRRAARPLPSQISQMSSAGSSKKCTPYRWRAAHCPKFFVGG